MVGINDACSGIRSFQSTLMGVLFLGELYRLPLARRIILCIAGLLLAFALNVARSSLMVLVASRKGLAALDEWHDSAGLSILLVTMAGAWVLSIFLKREGQRSPGRQEASKGPELLGQGLRFAGQFNTEDARPGGEAQVIKSGAVSRRGLFFRLSLGLGIWLAIVEVTTAVWFHKWESTGASTPQGEWALRWPTDCFEFTRKELPKPAQKILRSNLGEQASWSEGGVTWRVFAIEWFPGRLASYFANRHRPEICMRAAGYELLSGPEPIHLNVRGLTVPTKRYSFQHEGSRLIVFHCIWQGASSAGHAGRSLDLLRGTWVKPAELGRQVIEITVSGIVEMEDAKTAATGVLDALLPVTAAQ
ncbi:MAG: exosortase/archaeosortase family protein [Verrucomicrobiia bacterium]